MATVFLNEAFVRGGYKFVLWCGFFCGVSDVIDLNRPACSDGSTVSSTVVVTLLSISMRCFCFIFRVFKEFFFFF